MLQKGNVDTCLGSKWIKKRKHYKEEPVVVTGENSNGKNSKAD